MNTILFWDKNNQKSIRIKVTQKKLGMWRDPQVHTPASAFRLAKANGWLHVTSKTKMFEL